MRQTHRAMVQRLNKWERSDIGDRRNWEERGSGEREIKLEKTGWVGKQEMFRWRVKSK